MNGKLSRQKALSAGRGPQKVEAELTSSSCANSEAAGLRQGSQCLVQSDMKTDVPQGYIILGFRLRLQALVV